MTQRGTMSELSLTQAAKIAGKSKGSVTAECRIVR